MSQKLIDLTGENVTNADTPSYHRQVAELRMAADVAGAAAGDGVDLTSIARVINQIAGYGSAINELIIPSDSSASAQLSRKSSQLQTLLAPGAGSLDDSLANFFNAAQTLSANPDDPTLRQSFLSAASGLTGQLNTASTAKSTQLSGSLAHASASSIGAGQHAHDAQIMPS